MKKVLSLVLSIVMLMSITAGLDFSAFALVSGNFEYKTENGEATIIKYDGTEENIEVPSTLGGCPVTTIGNYAFNNCDSIKTVKLPDTIITIGGWAFRCCDNLSSINIPNGVLTIGNDAFWWCDNLKEITLPDSVTSIGDDAFDDTPYYDDENNWENNALYIGKHLIKVRSSFSGEFAVKAGTKTIADDAFCNCESLTSVSIPNSVVTIGSEAFKECRFLTDVSIANGVTTIGEHAFVNCVRLESVTIPGSVTTIGNYAFYNCTSLASITIPNSVTTIGYEAFENCTSLTSIAIPNSVTTIGYEAFSGCTSLINVSIPNSVTTIESHTFCNCTSLQSIVIPNGVKTISFEAFYNCTSLKSVYLPSSITGVSSSAFYNCTSLKDVYYDGYKSQWNKIYVELPDGVTVHCKQCSKHVWKVTSSTKSSLYSEGRIDYVCTTCGDTKTVKINKIKSVAISATSYTYDGKVKKPAVTVKDSAGKTIASSNYTVTYKNNKNIGIASVVVTFKGNYSGLKTLNFDINPKGTQITKLTPGKSQFTAAWSKQASNTVGYQVSYSTDKSFKKNVKTVVYDKDVTKATYKKLTKGKTYYVKVRTFQHVGRTVCYSKWSTVQKVKVK